MATYLVLAVAANWNAWSMGAARTLEPSQDPKLNAWGLSWNPYALAHGLNPFFSHLVNVPFGVNDAANVSLPFLSMLASPITAWWGPVASDNVLISLSFFATAASAYFFVRHWTRWQPAAFVGGLLFGFSPYMVGQNYSHLNLSFIAFVPVIFVLLDEIIVRQTRPPLLLGCALGVVVICQYFVSSEVLASTAIVTAIGLVLVAALNHRQVAAHLVKSAIGLGAGLVLVTVVLAYPVWFSVDGPQHYSLAIAPGAYQADLWGAVLPTSNQVLAPASWTAISDQFVGNLAENGSYLGLPLILALAATLALLRRSKVVVVACLITLAAYVLSLGSPLEVKNHHTTLTLPWAVLHHLPLLKAAIPARVAMMTTLFAALVLGVALDRLRHWERWPTVWSGVAGALVLSGVVLLPLLPSLPYTVVTVDTPTFFTTSAVLAVPSGSLAVVYPITTPYDTDAMLWQASAHMRFAMPGGNANVPTPGTGVAQPEAQSLTVVTLTELQTAYPLAQTPALRHSLRAQWRAWGVRSVIVGPGGLQPSAALGFFTWLLGAPPRAVAGVHVWYGVQRLVSAG